MGLELGAITTALKTASTVASVGSAVGGFIQSRNQAAAQQESIAIQQQRLRDQENLRTFQQNRINRQIRSQQQAQLSKAGITLTGSAAALTRRTAAEQELDLLVNQFNTDLQIEDLDQESNAVGLRAQGEQLGSLIQIPTILGGVNLGGSSNGGDNPPIPQRKPER